MAKNIPKKAADAGKSPSDASKVQPKKETVRINLPPKPTAAATVKIPAPAPAIGARPAPSSAPTTPASRTAAATQKLPAAPSAVPRRASVPSAPPRPAPSMAPRRASRSATPAISDVGKSLAIIAVVLLVLVVAQLFWIGM